MDLVKDDIVKLYYRFLLTSFFSTLIGALYSVVDMIIIGQYQGHLGTAALAVVAPTYNIIFGLGLLFGIGGSVLYSKAKGEGSASSNEFYTAAFVLTSAVTLLLVIVIFLFSKNLFIFFGADEQTLPLAEDYFRPIKWGIPFMLFNQLLSSFIRNDKDPYIPTLASVVPCLLNIAGDYICVFVLKMGIYGAGLATFIGNALAFFLLLTHFLKKGNSLHLVKTQKLFFKFGEVVVNGFSPFLIDMSMGIVTIIFNRQILTYMSDIELSVYGVIINVSTMEQCTAYGIGQSAQPLISENYGAKQYLRIRKVLFHSLISCALLALVWASVNMADPSGMLGIFMQANEEVEKAAILIFRRYSLAFIFLPFNVFATYYFESVMKAPVSLLVSSLRGILLPAFFLCLLPLWFAPETIWYGMPLTELLVFLLNAVLIYKDSCDFKKKSVLKEQA
jgi:putative MATE family efflux protein